MTLHWKASDGTGPAEHLATFDDILGLLRTHDWADEEQRVVVEIELAETGQDVGLLSLEGDQERQMLLETEANEFQPAVSPDGRWLAYVSDETGQPEVYMQRFPGLGDKRQVSSQGGMQPLWSPLGGELLYRQLPRDGAGVMAVPVRADATLVIGSPALIIDHPYHMGQNLRRTYDISADGQRFLMIKVGGVGDGAPLPHLNVIVNWTEELKRLVPTE